MSSSFALQAQTARRAAAPARQLLAAAVVLVMAVGLLVSAGWGTTAAASTRIGDRDCGDFASQKAAQIFFLHHGGPQSDPHGLDADGDGIACESNPCPCYFGTGGGGGGGGSTTPVKDTHVTIAPSRRAGIPGERLVLSVHVKPATSRAVTVQKRTSGGWHALTRGRTNAQGALQVRSSVNKVVTRYRAVVPKTTSGSPRYRVGVSRARVVQPQIQTVRLVAPRFAEQDSRLVVTAVARPIREGRKVELWAPDAHGVWKRQASGQQDRHGKETFRIATQQLGSRDFRVKVLSRDGASAVTSARESITVRDTVAPKRPLISKIASGDHAIILWWQAVAADDAVGYVLFAAPSGDPLVEVKRVGPKATMTRLKGLTGGVSYDVAIAAFDEVHNYSRRSTFEGMIPFDHTAPAAPSNVSLAPGQGTLDVTWSAPPDDDVASYVVRYQVTGDSTWTERTSGTTDLQITGLADDTGYTVQVAAVDLSGNQSPWSDLASATTLPPLDETPPATPGGVNAMALDADSIQVTWDAVIDDDLAGYVVEHALASDGPWTASPLTSATSATIDGLQADTAYYVRVAARDGTGNQSTWSAAVPVATAP